MSVEKKIKKLKTKAKKAYLKYENIIESYDCGSNLAEYISPELSRAKLDYNNAMTQLKELDPTCPISSI